MVDDAFGAMTEDIALHPPGDPLAGILGVIAASSLLCGLSITRHAVRVVCRSPQDEGVGGRGGLAGEGELERRRGPASTVSVSGTGGASVFGQSTPAIDRRSRCPGDGGPRHGLELDLDVEPLVDRQRRRVGV